MGTTLRPVFLLTLRRTVWSLATATLKATYRQTINLNLSLHHHLCCYVNNCKSLQHIDFNQFNYNYNQSYKVIPISNCTIIKITIR